MKLAIGSAQFGLDYGVSNNTGKVPNQEVNQILNVAKKSGINFLRDKKIDSLYSIAIHDKKLNKIFISRDWPGRIPLYYHHESKH